MEEDTLDQQRKKKEVKEDRKETSPLWTPFPPTTYCRAESTRSGMGRGREREGGKLLSGGALPLSLCLRDLLLLVTFPSLRGEDKDERETRKRPEKELILGASALSPQQASVSREWVEFHGK